MRMTLLALTLTLATLEAGEPCASRPILVDFPTPAQTDFTNPWVGDPYLEPWPDPAAPLSLYHSDDPLSLDERVADSQTDFQWGQLESEELPPSESDRDEED